MGLSNKIILTSPVCLSACLSVGRSVGLSCFRIRCCRTQTRCMRGAPRCRRAGESCNIHTRTQNEPYLFVTSPHINIYHTRGRTLLTQTPHTNESILCHEPSPPRTIIVTCPSCTVYPTDPERSRTPTAMPHHSGIMMPRHI